MSRSPEVEQALGNLRRCHEAGRLAHAYLVVGAPRREAAELAEAVIEMLLGGAGPTARNHPDVLWIEPRSKLRTIKIDDIRALNHRMQTTSFSGGWKIGVLGGADRMQAEAANAFLKTLEEPPPRSLLLLLTDTPEAVLPTIRSRAQMLHVLRSQTLPEGAWRNPLLDILRSGAPVNSLQAVQRAGQIDALIQQEKKRISAELQGADASFDENEGADEEVEDEVLAARIVARTLEVQADMQRAILLWHRDLLFCCLGVDETFLHFPEDRDRLQAQAAGVAPGQMLRFLHMQEEAMFRMQRLASVAPLEQAFFAWGRLAQRAG